MNEKKLHEYKQWISEGALMDEIVEAEEFVDILDLAIESFALQQRLREVEASK